MRVTLQADITLCQRLYLIPVVILVKGLTLLVVSKMGALQAISTCCLMTCSSEVLPTSVIHVLFVSSPPVLAASCKIIDR